MFSKLMRNPFFSHTCVAHACAYMAHLDCWREWEAICSWHHWLPSSLCLLFPNLHGLTLQNLEGKTQLNGGWRVASKDKITFRKDLPSSW